MIKIHCVQNCYLIDKVKCVDLPKVTKRCNPRKIKVYDNDLKMFLFYQTTQKTIVVFQ